MDEPELKPKSKENDESNANLIGYFGDIGTGSNQEEAKPQPDTALSTEQDSGSKSIESDGFQLGKNTIFEEGWSRLKYGETEKPTETDDSTSAAKGLFGSDSFSQSEFKLDYKKDGTEKPITVGPLFKSGWSSDFDIQKEQPKPDSRSDEIFKWDNTPNPYFPEGTVIDQLDKPIPQPDTRFNWEKDSGVKEQEPYRPTDGSDREVERELPKTGDRVTDTINTISDIPNRHKQMVVVTTASKGSTTGELRIYDRNGSAGWVDTGERIPINVGRNGLNWGVRNQELLDTSDLSDNRKVEGDGTGPIGMFTVSGAFGLKSYNGIQSQLQNNGANFVDVLPYRQIRPGSQWVSTRDNYNVWIDGGRHSVKEDLYKIAKSGLYEYGLVLGYNGADMFNGNSTDGYPVGEAQYKGGSAIFAHVERGPGRPTAGCTSMSRSNMVKLMATLENSKKPLWLQIPKSELDKIEGKRFTYPRNN